MSDELLPCPFCEGKGVAKEIAYMHFVECEVCGGTGAFRDEMGDAIKAWNTRAPVRTTLTDAPEGYEPKRLETFSGGVEMNGISTYQVKCTCIFGDGQTFPYDCPVHSDVQGVGSGL